MSITPLKLITKALPMTLLVCFFITDTKAAFASTALTYCETKNQTSIVYMRCLDRQIAKLDEERLLWGNDIIFALEEQKKNSGQGGALRLFKKSQQSYTKHAENHCRWQYLRLMPDPTASAIKYKQCLVQMGEKRVEELKLASKS